MKVLLGAYAVLAAGLCVLLLALRFGDIIDDDNDLHLCTSVESVRALWALTSEYWDLTEAEIVKIEMIDDEEARIGAPKGGLGFDVATPEAPLVSTLWRVRDFAAPYAPLLNGSGLFDDSRDAYRFMKGVDNAYPDEYPETQTVWRVCDVPVEP